MGGTTTGAQAAVDGSGGWDAAAEPPPTAPPSAPAASQPPSSSQPTQSTPTTPAAASGGAAPGSTTPSGTPATPAPAAPTQPVVVTSQRAPGIMGVVDSIADALVGKTKPEIGTDPQGNQYIKQQTLTRGQQWVKIGAGLVGGAAKGFAAGKGRNPGAAAAAGFDEGKQQAKDTAAQTPELQKQILANANYQKLRMDTAEQSWHLTAMKHQATEHDIEFAQGQEDRLMKVDGATLLGTAADPNDIDKILKVDPNVMKSMIQDHQIEILPHYNADGTAAGIRVFKMPDGYRKTLEPAGTVFHTFDSTTGQFVAHKSSEALTAGEVDDYETAAGNAAQKFKLDQANIQQKQAATDEAKANAGKANAEATKVPSEIAETKARTTQAYSAAAKDAAQAKQLNEAGDTQTIQSNAQQLVEGQADPSNLSKRSKTYDATLAAANAYSMQKYGKPFDLAKAAGDYKFATNTQTYNTLNYLNSLTGRDNQSGNLGKLVQMSDAMPRATSFPPLNDAAQWAKLSSGNVQVANYYAAVTEVADQVAKILQGGGSGGGGTSDAKLKQAQDLFAKGFTAAQVKGVANDTLRPLLANRKQEIIGDNRYLQQWHQPPPNQQQAHPGQPPVLPAGAPPPAAGMSRIWAPGSPTWKDVPTNQVPKNIPGLVVHQ
jgi:hypothetical protein